MLHIPSSFLFMRYNNEPNMNSPSFWLCCDDCINFLIEICEIQTKWETLFKQLNFIWNMRDRFIDAFSILKAHSSEISRQVWPSELFIVNMSVYYVYIIRSGLLLEMPTLCNVHWQIFVSPYITCTSDSSKYVIKVSFTLF